MFKWLLITAVVAGGGYAAFTVPVAGKTVAVRAMEASPWTIKIARKDEKDRLANAPPSETITASEREALDKLVRR